MSDALAVDLFVEDRAHEQFLIPLLHRIAKEESVAVTVRVRAARGGHARTIHEFELYQRLVEKGATDTPDLVIVGIDGNCTTSAKKKLEIANATIPSLATKVIAACPDPHVERWYLADPDSFKLVVGHQPRVSRKKCVRDYYKRLLADSVRLAGQLPTLGGVEFAAELVAGMDLYRAGRNDHSLRAFLDDLRAQLRQARRQEES